MQIATVRPYIYAGLNRDRMSNAGFVVTDRDVAAVDLPEWEP